MSDEQYSLSETPIWSSSSRRGVNRANLFNGRRPLVQDENRTRNCGIVDVNNNNQHLSERGEAHECCASVNRHNEQANNNSNVRDSEQAAQRAGERQKGKDGSINPGDSKEHTV